MIACLFILIKPLKVVESALILEKIAAESEATLDLNEFDVSDNAAPDAEDNKFILLDKFSVSLPIRLLNMVEVSDILILLDNMVAVSVFLNKLPSIEVVSAILSLKLILPFNALALSTNDLLITVESFLNLVVILVESNNIFVINEVESFLNLAAVTAESLFNLSLMALTLSESAVLEPDRTKSILDDKLSVSFPILLLNILEVSDSLNVFDNMVNVSEILSILFNILAVSDILSLLLNIVAVSVFLSKFLSIVKVSEVLNLFDNILAVSEIFNFKLILSVIAAALSINDDVSLVESNLNLSLSNNTLSPNAEPVAFPN